MLASQKKENALYQISAFDERIKWSWATRLIPLNGNNVFEVETANSDGDRTFSPRVGDLAIFKVLRLGRHKSIITTNNKRFRLYAGELLVGVFGNRYATDAYEGEVNGVEDLSVLTAAGMVGSVKSMHHSAGKPTRVSFVGYLKMINGSYHRINLKDLRFRKAEPSARLKNLILIVGSGMNSGKTTTCRKLIKSLSEAGFKVAACKLTGSVSNRDQDEMRAATAVSTVDFSEYGFPSTYKCDRDELIDLFKTMLTDIVNTNPDVTFVEIADGILQRETAMLLTDPFIQDLAKGVIVTAETAPSALYTSSCLKKMGYKIIAVSGALTSSPLYIREFRENSEIPVISSIDDKKQRLKTVVEFIESNQ
jgi:hypothetical protein